MDLVLNTNVPSLIAQAKLKTNSNQVNKSMERLASGYRINRAADDAAGLNISQSFIGQIKRMQQASRNTQDGISVLQTAESALAVITDTLQRIRELAVQGANDTNSTAARDAIEGEIMQLMRDIDRIANGTEFNGIRLLNGTATNAIIQVGPNSTAATNTMNISTALAATGTGDGGGPGGLTLVGGAATFANINAVGTVGINAGNAQGFITDVNNAINIAIAQRARMGSFQNQLESITLNLASSIENFTQSNSRIRDLDVAEEASTLAQYQVLQQASVSILSQTNQIPQMVLNLLQQR